MEVLGCQSWDVGAVLTTDKEVARLNRQVRQANRRAKQATASKLTLLCKVDDAHPVI